MAITGVMMALLAAAIVILLSFDVNRLKPYINEKVSAALGRRFLIRGDLQLTWRRMPGTPGPGGWVPWPQLLASDLVIGNPAWARVPQFASLKRVSFALSPWALLRHRIEVPAITLAGPGLDIERLADGRNNWSFNPATPQGPSRWTIQIGAIVFDKGTIAVNDAARQIRLDLLIDPLGKPIPYSDIVNEHVNEHGSASLPPAHPRDYVFGVRAEGYYGQARVHGEGKVGRILALTNPDDAFPVEAEATVGDTHVGVAGTLTDPLHLGALDLKLHLAAASMAHLYALTGVALPETPPFATTGHLQATLARGGSRFHYRHFTGHVGGSDLAGDVVFVQRAPRPLLSGEMHSELLQFNDLAPLLASEHRTPETTPTAPATQPQPSDKFLPVATFRTDRWNAMDAAVVFSARKISRETTAPIENVSAHILLDNGKLTLRPLSFAMAGGNISGVVVLDGGKVPLQGDMTVQLRHLELPRLFPNIRELQSALGEFNGDLKLTATGNSVAELAAHASGEAKVLLEQGIISRNLLELAGLNLANVVEGKLFGDKTVAIQCVAADLTADRGQMTSKLFVADTDDAEIVLRGGADLATEQMDFRIDPRSKGLRLLSLRSPLYIRGTFKNPRVGVDVGRVALKGAAALGLATVAPAAALLPLIAPGHSDTTHCGRLVHSMQAPPAASGRK
jgi:uncharacterized protein involved in outer membrane biogenesis